MGPLLKKSHISVVRNKKRNLWHLIVICYMITLVLYEWP